MGAFIIPARLSTAAVRRAMTTQASATLYVTTDGNDTTGTGAITAPFLTPQAALDSLAKGNRHRINILVGTGSFPGFAVKGFTIDPSVGSNPVGINMLATRVSATLSSGTPAGTITSTTAGSLTTPAWTVIEDTAQNWVVDALKGMFFELANGTMETIFSNTDKTVTLETTSAFGSVAGTYVIRECGTIITGSISLPPLLPLAQGTPGAAATVGIAVYDNIVGDRQWLRIEGFKVSCSSPAASTGVEISSNVGIVRFDRNVITGNVTTGLNFRGPGAVVGQSNVFDVRNTNGAAVAVNSPNATITLVRGLMTNLASSTVQNAVLIQTSGILATFSGHMEKHLFGIKVTAGFGVMLNLTGLSIDTGASQGILCSGEGHSGFSGCTISISGVEIKNCSSGIQIAGHHTVQATSLVGTGNTTGLTIYRGTRFQVDAASTISGSTGVDLDGTLTTLDHMRSLTPKLTSSAYFTTLYE